MKAHTSNFKEQIKTMGRELDSKITYTLNGINVELGKEQLNSITPTYQGALLKSVMKELDIDSNVYIPEKTVLNYQFGVKVNGKYEYINFGNYVVYKAEKQEDTNSYKLTCYDKMLYSMVDYEKMDITYPITIRDYIKAICDKLGITFANASDTFANYDKQIQNELYLDSDGNSLGYTFRDVFDELAQVTASTICINDNDELEIRYINDTGDTIDEEFLKDINVNFGERFGAVNTIVLSRSANSDNIYYPEVLPENPCEFKISDNQIMNGNDRSDYLPDIYNKLNGLEFYINDFSSTGICYYELLDRYNVQIGDNTYSCIMLNDEINITQGLEENIYTEMPEETKTDYTKADKNDRKINQTYLIVDKQGQQIESVVTNLDENYSTTTEMKSAINQKADEINIEVAKKVGKSEVISSINLSNEQIKIKSNKLALEGYTTINQGFSVDLNGKATMKNATINGGNIELIDTNDDEETPKLMIYNENQIVNVKTDLAVGVNMSGVKLNMDFPNKFSATETSPSVAFYNLVTFQNGSIRYNYGYQYSEYITIYFHNDDGDTILYQGNGVEDAQINLTEFTLPASVGNITNLDDTYKDITNNKSLIKHIFYYNQQIGDRTEYRSDGIYVKTGNDYCYHDINGMSIKDNNGTRYFKNDGITWMTPYGVAYKDFIVNKDICMYGGNNLVQGTNVLKLNMINTPYLEIVLSEPVSGIYTYGVTVWQSDKRLKENIKDSNYNALEFVRQIKHREFDFIKSKKNIKIGYIADELEEIDKNAIFEVGEEKTKQPDVSYIIPILSKAIQELENKVDLLNDKINKLEGRKNNE